MPETALQAKIFRDNIDGLIKKYTIASEELLENIGSKEAVAGFKGEMQGIVVKLSEAVKTQFPDIPNKAALQILRSMQEFSTRMEQFYNVAETMHILKISGTKGLDIQQLVVNMQDRAKSALSKQTYSRAEEVLGKTIYQEPGASLSELKSVASQVPYTPIKMLGRLLPSSVGGKEVIPQVIPKSANIAAQSSANAIKNFLAED